MRKLLVLTADPTLQLILQEEEKMEQEEKEEEEEEVQEEEEKGRGEAVGGEMESRYASVHLEYFSSYSQPRG